jgi:tetratricopeptide (TPR) repeat protein
MATIPEALAIALEHHQAGRLQAAEQIYRRILDVEPGHAEAIHLLGVLAHQVGRNDVAIEYIDRAIRLNGEQPAFHYNLGEAHLALHRTAEAVACYRRALELKPDFAEAHNDLGSALQDQGQLAEAIACHRRAVELRPHFAEAHYNLGNALRGQGRVAEAIVCYQRALELKPDYANGHNNLGSALHEQGRIDEAIACYQQALALQPDFAGAYYNLGNALKDRRRVAEAIPCYQRALALQPDLAEAHCNLGIAWKDQGNLDAAMASFQRALELKPDFVEAHCNVGLLKKNQGKLDEATAWYRRAIELKPDYADGHLNQSLLRLLRGDFAEGWREYEWRWQTRQSRPRQFQQPRWDGGSLAGKTILLHAEQGLGDTIHFIRYAPLVKQLGATVIVECQRALERLLAGCPGVDRFIAQGDELPAFDVHAPLLDLPKLFRTDLTNLPASIPYVRAAPELIDRWQRRLAQFDGFRVGIAWQGSPTYVDDRYRSIPLVQFAPLAAVPGVRLFSLQKGAGREQLAETGGRFSVVDLADELDESSGPFMDTAAVMANLDLVIASDSAVVHLAGALGVPIWVALPLVPDWRWLLDRSDSPWYPTMRLFRQRRIGDWQGVFEEIGTALRERLIPRQDSTSGFPAWLHDWK